MSRLAWIVLLSTTLLACGRGTDTEADDVGVGAECTTSEDCPDNPDTGAPELVCLTQFAGGYCGLSDCTGNDDCPEGSACVAHDDGANYCFRQCVDKSECNVNRSHKPRRRLVCRGLLPATGAFFGP